MRSTAVPTSRFMLLKSPSTGLASGGLVMNLTGAMFVSFSFTRAVVYFIFETRVLIFERKEGGLLSHSGKEWGGTARWMGRHEATKRCNEMPSSFFFSLFSTSTGTFGENTFVVQSGDSGENVRRDSSREA